MTYLRCANTGEVFAYRIAGELALMAPVEVEAHLYLIAS